MALMACHECGNQVSTEAKACPSCGAPPKVPVFTRKLSIVKGLAIFIAGLCVIGYLIETIYGPSNAQDSVIASSYLRQSQLTGPPAQHPETVSRSHAHAVSSGPSPADLDRLAKSCPISDVGCAVGDEVMTMSGPRAGLACSTQAIKLYVDYERLGGLDSAAEQEVVLERFRRAAGVENLAEAKRSCTPLRDGERFRIVALSEPKLGLVELQPESDSVRRWVNAFDVSAVAARER